MKTNKLMGALGLCRRAGALAVGYEAVCEAARAGAPLVLVTYDTAKATRNKIERACVCSNRLETLPLSQQQLADILRKPVGVLAVTNADLAVLCLGAMPEQKLEEEQD